ncbi:MAG: hypothetical protein EBZ49_13945 [Proteobacteria bacterium]|nr:hypothetical protein [Pseudomonadota bacterium]
MLRNGQTLIAVFVLLSFVASFANSEDLGVTTGQAAAQAAPSKDRKDNLNGASAAALAAGAMAQLSCMQMMKPLCS